MTKKGRHSEFIIEHARVHGVFHGVDDVRRDRHPDQENLGLNETQFGILVAMPVLTGSLIRVPLGMWTDKFGGRIVFFILMLSTVFPIWLISRATEFWHFLVTGLFVGVAGGSFTVGIAYCARWFPKHRQGFAMGIFGAGNTGRGGEQVRRAGARGGVRLGDGAAGVCRAHAGHGGPVLVLHL